MIGDKCSILLCMFLSGKEDRALIAQVHFHAGLDFQLVGEFRIHSGAGTGDGLERGGGFKGASDQHSTGSVRGFATGFSALDDQNGGAAPAQGDREREADDAASDDEDIPSLHVGIVKDTGIGVRTRNEDDRERVTA